MDISQKKEMVLASFRQAFDKQMAYLKVGLTLPEIDELEKDAEFQMRLNYVLIDEREAIIGKLRGFMDSENETISFKATTDLGKILYNEFFSRLDPATTVNVNNIVSSKKDLKEEQRVKDEYAELLKGKMDVPVTDGPNSHI